MLKRMRKHVKVRKETSTKDIDGPIQIKEIKQSVKEPEQQGIEGKEAHFRFHPDSRYFTISVYVIAVLTIGIIIIQSIINLPHIALAVDKFLGVIEPFIVAFFIAFIVNPIVKSLSERFYGKTCRIRNKKACLAFGIATAYIIIIGLIVAFCFYVVPQISASIASLTDQLPELYDRITTYLEKLEDNFTLDLGWAEAKLNELMPQLVTMGTDFVKNVIPKLLDLSISIAKLVINILLSIAISIYMLYDKRSLSKNATRVLYSFVPKKKANSTLGVVKECGNIFTNFIVGKTIDSTIIGMICFVLMSILKLDYAVLLSVIVGVTNMIPYFGPFIGAIPGVVLFLCMSPFDALVFAIMILILQQFDGWVLGPKILGDSTGLTPLWVIFGITVGGAYGGVFGMFLGVPVIAVVAYLADLFIVSRLKKKNLDIQ